MSFSNSSNEIFNYADLQSLNELRSDAGPIFSLYLDLRAGNELERFNNLLAQTLQQKKLDQAPPDDRAPWDEEAARVRRWLEEQLPTQGLGLAIFSSTPADLWRVFLLPAPVLDRLEAGQRPFVRPLEVLLGESQCTLVALIDSAEARLVEVFLGTADEVTSLARLPVTGDAVAENQREHARVVAERIEAAWQERHCNALVIGGSDAALDDLRDELPEYLRERLAGEVRLSPLVELDEILAEVKGVEAGLEQEEEGWRVDELLRSDGSSVLGLEQSLMAVRSKKVRMLVAEEDFHVEGGECPNCGFLGEGHEGVCLLDGMALRPEPDIVEAAMKQVLDQGGEVEILRSAEWRSALEPHGHIGALLHTPGEPPPVKDASGHEVLADEGKVHPRAIHDETVEESFPASDPPGF